MDKQAVEELLRQVASGARSPEEAAEALAVMPYSDLGFAKLDVHRSLRLGQAEVIFCPGKTATQVVQIARKLRAHHELILATRADAELAEEILAQTKEHMPGAQVQYLEASRTVVFGQLPAAKTDGPSVAVVTAGTADIPVAEEVALIVVAAGYAVNCLYDVGVAGVHRLLGNLEPLRKADVTIVIAGMDGALASLVGGLLDKPVIAVPTSVGYGASFGGVAALLSMLSSCAPGVTVVNIDNGFGAAMAAVRLLKCLAKPI
ncbi:MAG: nickel pincer cofactor biosynthesis protein LarB [Cyanobacteria bacterium SZAS TMP-1]|nr:nickel pincer cofactor biosynthesis protein LarB [Cyanobacteria bacterium SZAS TMP-1]